ncbi:hypothetical protein MHYP_G00296180 [Metynnis hypsauchen]
MHNAARQEQREGSVQAQAVDPPSPALFALVTSSSSCVALSKGLAWPAPYCVDTVTIDWCPFTTRVTGQCWAQNVHKGALSPEESLELCNPQLSLALKPFLQLRSTQRHLGSSSRERPQPGQKRVPLVHVQNTGLARS